ncbi:hypothetical protein LH435_15270 [Laribacter hongkongensis]|uniref:hypothetical protein n=1 Tax=Laribacter hongkongensis TaxID=168471 RepID=UPI001EFC9C3B|nr:hypothetical protein [Laribacter hongkongensis]MCG8996679.1 hypothetical protein [Laribacter hongkongensis]MCG9011958.1 hypothetical protein [Laribacter hongkongensis]MCG9024243.1 hypothetical protein [Laribacter hongkongensis]MCG9048405.1 hypothetical protein [Laribacter hongkongensis]MCG9075333.1 hypothetical protein [Laribacter hongkongensis]
MLKAVTAAPLFAVLLAACGGNAPQEEQKAHAPLVRTVIEIEKNRLPPIVLGDGMYEPIYDYAEARRQAGLLVVNLDGEMQKNASILQRYRMEGLSPEVPEHGRRLASMVEMAEEQFGDVALMHPLGSCSSMATMAASYWHEQLSGNAKIVQDTAKKMYLDAVSQCKNAIKNPPLMTVNIAISKGAESPSGDCIKTESHESAPPNTDVYECPARIRR